jgi:hypothetical protein
LIVEDSKTTLNDEFSQSLKSSERLRSDGTNEQSETIPGRSQIEGKKKGNDEKIEEEFEVDEVGNEKRQTKHDDWMTNDSMLGRLILSKYPLQIIDHIEYNDHIVTRLKIIFEIQLSSEMCLKTSKYSSIPMGKWKPINIREMDKWKTLRNKTCNSGYL